MPMLRFGQCNMQEVMKHFLEMNQRFLTIETGIYAMTLTPPRAMERAAGNRLAGLLVARPDGKTTDELNAIG
jgi:hypothetical protein